MTLAAELRPWALAEFCGSAKQRAQYLGMWDEILYIQGMGGEVVNWMGIVSKFILTM